MSEIKDLLNFHNSLPRTESFPFSYEKKLVDGQWRKMQKHLFS